jgi:hypothetical protein
MDDLERNCMIEALERMELPPMPAKVQALIDASPPYLTELLRALADDMEAPGTGAARLASLPPEAGIIVRAIRASPMLCYTGLLQISKSHQRLRRETQHLMLENAKMERQIVGGRLH